MEKKYYYKAMSKDMQGWGNFQFKIGELYTIKSKQLELCSDRVFHFCKKLEDTIESYYSSTDRHFLIEVLGDIVTDKNKSGSNKIKIVREISREDIEGHIQYKDSLKAKWFLALYTTDVKMLEILSKDKNWEVRFFVAQNPNTPVHILEDLVKDEDWAVRKNVASNPNTPVYLLKKLSNDKDNYVHRAVASNPNTPVYILENLVKDEDFIVRCFVTSNPTTNVYILKTLSKDENETVSKKAQARLKEITQ